MRKGRKLQDQERQEEVYLIESKLTDSQKQSYIDIFEKSYHGGIITQEHHEQLQNRVNEGWICEDALSYSYSIEEAKKLYQQNIESTPYSELKEKDIGASPGTGPKGSIKDRLNKISKSKQDEQPKHSNNKREDRGESR